MPEIVHHWENSVPFLESQLPLLTTTPSSHSRTPRDRDCPKAALHSGEKEGPSAPCCQAVTVGSSEEPNDLPHFTQSFTVGRSTFPLLSHLIFIATL